MNDSVHISDEELKSVAIDKASPSVQSLVEDHISLCKRCQNRILELAVDLDWRTDIVQKCNTFRHEVENEFSLAFTSSEGFDQRSPSGDSFDLQTVEQMLEQLLAPPTHPEILGRLGRYDIEGVLGCGGMGVVLKGFDRDLYRPVAIKMILPRLSKNGTAKLRFAREARAAAVVLHPNVIAIYGIETTNDVPWIVMPLILGPTLKALVAEHGPLPEREIVRIGNQIASGLAAAHSQGLVHRDIKPENILIDNHVNRVVITDFGLARQLADEPMTQTGFLAGTIGYMSPEQSRGTEIDGRSDLFSLGGLLYFLATGQPPFGSSSPMSVIHAIGNEQHSKVQALNNEISGTLAKVIDRLLEKDPGNRFQSAVELETYLNDFLFHLQQPLLAPAPCLEPTKTTARPSLEASNPRNVFSKSRWLILGILIAVAGGGTWWSVNQWPAIAVQETAQDNELSMQESEREASFGRSRSKSPAGASLFRRKSESPSYLVSPSRNLTAFQQANLELDEQLDGWLAEHWLAWNELKNDPNLTIEKVEAVRKTTLDKFPPMAVFQPTHIRKIKTAALLQSGPARELAIERLREFSDDQSEQGAMAAFLMFDVAVQFPMGGYPEGESEEDRLLKRQKALAQLLGHTRIDSVFKADKKLEIFTFLRRMNSPETCKQYPQQITKLMEFMIESRQTSLHSEYVDCFEVVKTATAKSGDELRSIRFRLIEFANQELSRLKAKKQVDKPEIHKHSISSLEGQIQFLETVGESGTLIGKAAPQLEFLWSSNDAIKSWNDTKGKVCVLYFSTANCGPCVKSVPKLIELNRTIATHGAMAEKIHFIGITSQQGIVPLKKGAVDCQDDFQRECELTLQYIEESEINWPIVFTKQSVFNPSFGARSVPHMVILDPEGAIRDFFNPFEESGANILKRIGAIVK